MTDHILVVKMAEISVVKNSMRIKTTLGSCVGIIISDSKSGVSGLAHIMLPEKLRNDKIVGKYADTAIPALLEEMKGHGSRRANLKAYLIGGATMFQFSTEKKITDIGERNIETTKRILKELQIPIVFEETGGNYGRTIIFDNATHEVSIKTLDILQKIGD